MAVEIVEDYTMELPPANYEYVTTEEAARNALNDLIKYPSLAVDTETTSLDPFTCKISLIQIGISNKAYVFDVRNDTEHSSVDPMLLKFVLEDNKILKILQNAVFDMKVIKSKYGYYINNIYDTMLVEQLFNLGKGFVKAGLADLVLRYLGMKMPKEPRNTFTDYNQVFKPYQLAYSANDVLVLHMIKDLQTPRILKEGLEDAARLEFEFTKPMCEMELNGITIDVDKWRIIMEDIDSSRLESFKMISNMLSTTSDQSTLFDVPTVNIDSPIQLKQALEKFGISDLNDTSVGSLSKFAGIPVIDSLLDYRKANKLISTYGESLLEKIHPITSRLHTQFKQMVSTGRMSSSNPNLQNIPREQKYRSCFIAREGYSLITADMSGAELRILGNLSADPVFIECYTNGIDLHTRTSSEIFGVPMEKVDHAMRNAAKAVNFGLCIQEDSIISTSCGNVKIKDVPIGVIAAHDKGNDNIIDKKYMGEKEVFELTTQYGYTLECTEDHLIKVIDSEGNYLDKRVKDIDLDNDKVCIKSKSELFSPDAYMFDEFDFKNVTNSKDFDPPKVLDRYWASFLGLLVSEGHLHKGKSGRYDGVTFGMSAMDDEFIKYIDKLLYKLFGTFGRYESERIITYSINSVKLTYWLSSIIEFKHGDKTCTIDIPECIMRSPKEIQVAFLKTLFEGDGTISKHSKSFRVSYSSMSIKLIKSLQQILLNFGVISSIKEDRDKRYPNRRYFKLNVVGESSRLSFIKQIGFLTNRKNLKAKHISTFKRSFYSINFSQKKLSVLQKNVSLNRKIVKNKEINSCNWYLYNNLNIFHKFKIGNAYFKELSFYDPTIKFLYDNNIIPLSVKSIKSVGVKKVYDLSIENHQYFLANGFIVHNCYGLSPVGLAKRLKIREDDAKRMINTYFDRYKGVKNFLERSAKDAIANLYSRSISGRKRYYTLPSFDSPEYKKIKGSIERQAKNAPIQGCIIGNSNIKGLGNIDKYTGKKVILETGFGKDSAIGVYSGKKEVYNLKLSNGAYLGITLDHKIPLLTDEGLMEKSVKNIELNKDYLLVPLDVEDGEVTDLSGYKYEKGHWRDTHIDRITPEIMSEELAFIIGCLIGDGNYNCHNFFRFCCSEPQKELFDKFNTFIKTVFKVEPTISMFNKYSKNNYRHTILYDSMVSSVVIRGFLKYIGLDYVTGKDKSIPGYFYTETIKNRGALLNGLFSTDGGMTKESGPNYTTISKQLAEDIQQLLFSLGINSNLKTYSEGGGLVYRIQIPKRFNSKFKKLIGFSVNEKNILLEKEGCSPKCGDGSIVPEFIPKLIEKTLRKSETFMDDFTPNEKAHLRRFKLGKCSFTSWRKFYKKLPECEEKKFLKRFLNFDFCKSTSLDYRGIEDTYDLICDNIHYFTANGVIVHNSNADTIKQAMVYLVDRLEKGGYDAKLVLTVHDEVVVEARNDQCAELAKLIPQALIDGFGKYFSLIPMETDALIGPCWLKGTCEAKIDGKECGNNEMKFIPDSKYGTKLVCAKCGTDI